MHTYETYASVLMVLSIALLLIVAGLSKKHLEWRPLPVRSRRRKP